MAKNTKTSLCRFEYARSLGLHVVECKHGSECYNVHDISEIKIKSHIKEWTEVKKNDINILQIKEIVINTLETGKTMINNPKFCSKIHNIKELEFDEILNLWYEIACHYRKMSNEMKDSKDSTIIREGFQSWDLVPRFELKDPTNKWTEDMIWALERSLHMCPIYYEQITKKKYTFDNICCGAINCKLGVHEFNDLICIDNMMEGKCECISMDEYITKKIQLEKKIDDKVKEITTTINDLKQQLTPVVDDDGFETTLPKKMRENISKKITALTIELKNIPEQHELNNHFRLVHLTEQGMVPMNKRIQEQKDQIAKMDKIEVKEVKKLVKKSYK